LQPLSGASPSAGLPGGGHEAASDDSARLEAGTGPVLSVQHASKSFGAVRAVIDGSIDLYGGGAHALLGENGAGKSTMVRMLAGVHQPDTGQLLIDGQPVVLGNPAAAQSAGVAVIYQEPTLFPDLTVSENIFMGRQPLLAGRRIDRWLMREQATVLFGRLGVPLDPDRICRGLSIADQQLVEIAKALSLNARVIVMDEPTAALSAAEVARLFDVVRALRSAGAAVLFITHRLEEVFEICQRATVMRDGEHVLTAMVAEVSADDLVRSMVGRQMPGQEAAEHGAAGQLVPRVHRLTREGVFTDISFDVCAGEIVALAGLVGSGRTEVARAVFGIDRHDAGSVQIQGEPLRKASAAAAMAAGIGFVPEDRRQQGLVMEMSVQQNVGLASLGRLQRAGLIRSGAERDFATDWAQRLSLKYGRLTDPVSRLSGSNQQKLVRAKWLSRQPRLLIVDEPTLGIDIATKAEVHRLLTQLARSGVAVLMIWSELPEVLQIGDRILVMREGRVTAELDLRDGQQRGDGAVLRDQGQAHQDQPVRDVRGHLRDGRGLVDIPPVHRGAEQWCRRRAERRRDRLAGRRVDLRRPGIHPRRGAGCDRLRVPAERSPADQFQPEAYGIVVGALLLVSVFVPNAGPLVRSSSSPSSAPSGKANAGGIKTGLKVFVIPKNLGNPYFTTADSVQSGGALAALKALGETGTETSGTAATPASQIPAIQAAITKGANALIVSATDPAALCPTLNSAMAKGITVVTTRTPPHAGTCS